jgi:hypothetical protein
MFASLLSCRPAARALASLENHRTLEGYAASLTAKQAALQVLFTFGPVAYVGLAGGWVYATYWCGGNILGSYTLDLWRMWDWQVRMFWLLTHFEFGKVLFRSHAVVDADSEALYRQRGIVHVGTLKWRPSRHCR